MLDLNDIAAIRAIAREGSLSRASHVLNTSQPTLSKRLARLEDRLGARIFLRSGRGAELTDVGRFLLAQSEGLAGEIERIGRQAQLLSEGGDGRLRLGVGPIVEELFLPRVALGFIESFPRVALEIRAARAATLLRWLLDGELDAVVGPFDGSEPLEDVITTAIAEHPVVFLARPSHPLARRKGRISPSAMAEHRLAAPDMPESIARQTLSGEVLSLLSGAVVQCPRYATLRTLARQADIVVAGPAPIFAEDLEAGRLRILDVDLALRWRAAFLSRRAAAEIAPVAALRVSFKQAGAALKIPT